MTVQAAYGHGCMRPVVRLGGPASGAIYFGFLMQGSHEDLGLLSQLASKPQVNPKLCLPSIELHSGAHIACLFLGGGGWGEWW